MKISNTLFMERKKHTIDATDRPLGRLASEIAMILRGKNKPEFQPHLDMGDIVEVENADKIVLTGKKMEQKRYYRHSGRPGSLKEEKVDELFQKDPGEVLKRSVKKMLPNNKLRQRMIKRLIIK